MEMVETSAADDGKLSFTVCCPVCQEKVPLCFVPGNERRSEFHSPSNFHRHVLRHTTSKAQRATRSSTLGKRSKVASPRKSKRSRPKDSDDDSDNDQIEKELIENYRNEDDDLIEDDEELEEIATDNSAVPINEIRSVTKVSRRRRNVCNQASKKEVLRK